MTVAEIIEQQRKQCEADKLARLNKYAAPKPAPVPATPPKSTPMDRERAYIEDRTYDGKAPNGGMGGIMRKENPDEYVGRDGTKTFIPWRYVSMQDLEIPDNGNPYRRPEQDTIERKPNDPWARPSGYMGSTAGSGMSPEYDPWSISGTVPSSQGGQDAAVDDWLAPTPAQQQMSTDAATAQADSWDSWMAPSPAPTQAGEASVVNTNGTLDIMRAMRP